MLTLTNLACGYSSDPLLKDITLSISGKDRRHIALLGDNGAGKTTFMKTLLGENDELEGSVKIVREHLSYIPQNIALPENQLVGEYLENYLEESWMDYKIDIALADVGLPEEALIKETQQLSGGERMRVFLARELLREPSILLMDEPTNHMDLKGLAWLGEFLNKFQGSSIIITHDRWFINTYMNTIWFIDRTEKTIEKYSGTYDTFLEWKAERDERQMDKYHREQHAMKEIKEWLKKNEFHPKYQFSAVVMSRKRALANMQRKATSKIEPPRAITLKAETGQEKDQRFLVAEVHDHPYIQKKEFSFQVRSSDVLHIKGPNGSGKTTLLHLLMKDQDTDLATIEWKEGIEVGYLGQHCSLPGEKTVLDAFHEATKELGLDLSHMRSILHNYFFSANDIDRLVQSFSLGEQRKLELATVLAKKPDILFLDEPTNHMDILTREIIETFLQESTLPLILISHDQYFVDKLRPTHVLEL